MSLAWVNSQISSTRRSIEILNSQLDKREEELERLQKASSELSDIQGDFQQNEKLVTLPDLTTTTWHGNLASKYDQFREGELLSSYRELYQGQLGRVLSDISAKISEIQNRIKTLEADIAALERQLRYLYALKEDILEEMRKND